MKLPAKTNGGISVTLLGTGTPIPDRDRHGPAQILEIAGDAILVDCGAGTLHRLLKSGIDPSSISHIFLTHLHSDHVSGINDLLWAGWVAKWWETAPLLIGPNGTKEFISRLIHAFEEDIRLRSEEGAVTPDGLIPHIIETEDGLTVEKNSWSASSFRVDHRPVKDAFGFRFEYSGQSVVISGDTRMCDNLVKWATDADILVNEVLWEHGMNLAISKAQGPQKARLERIQSYHISSFQVGQVASRANVKLLVLSHLMLAGGTPDDLVSDIQKSFTGPTIVGHDLARFSTLEARQHAVPQNN